MQTTINQRIKFLLEALGMSARNFGKAIGVAENTTQNYLEPRLAEPRAEYLERIVLHFESINAHWLLTGQGEAFLSNRVSEDRAVYQVAKKNRGGQMIGQVGRDAIHNHGQLASEKASMQRELDQLRQQVADKDQTIAAQQLTIQVLLGQKPQS